MSYPSLSVNLVPKSGPDGSYIAIRDEQTIETLKDEMRTRIYGIFETVILPEVRKELDEKKSIYSDNYVEIIRGYYDLSESKLNILVTKIPAEYGCETESCAQHAVSANVPVDLQPPHIRYVNFGIAVHQNMGPGDPNGQHDEYDVFVDRVMSKASIEVKFLLSEAANVLDANSQTFLQDKDTIVIDQFVLRQYSDISRVSVLFLPTESSLDSGKKPLDVVITSNSYYERFWVPEPVENANPEEMSAEQLQECQRLEIDLEDCSETALLQQILHHQAIDRDAIERENNAIGNALTLVAAGGAVAAVATVVTIKKLR